MTTTTGPTGLTSLREMPSEHVDAAQPAVLDEQISPELRKVATEAALRSQPAGDARCESCTYCLEPSADLSYCWHPKLRILVGSQRWCQWWDRADG